MATQPTPIAVRRIESTDMDHLDVGSPVLVRVEHAGEVFYDDAVVKEIKEYTVALDGRGRGRTVYPGRELNPDTEQIIGSHYEIIVRDAQGNEITTYADSSREVFDALYPEDDRYATRETMLRHFAREQVMVVDDWTPEPNARKAPMYGVEVNLRVFVETDTAPTAELVEALVTHLSAVAAEGGDPNLSRQVVRAQGRPIRDLRVVVSEDVFDEHTGKSQTVVRAVNVLAAQVSEFMRGQGTTSTQAIRYGTSVTGA